MCEFQSTEEAEAINSGNSGGPVVDSKGNCLLTGFGGDVGLLGSLNPKPLNRGGLDTLYQLE